MIPLVSPHHWAPKTVARRAATRSRTRGATSLIKVRKVCGSDGPANTKAPKTQIGGQMLQHVDPVVHRANNRAIGIAGRTRSRRTHSARHNIDPSNCRERTESLACCTIDDRTELSCGPWRHIVHERQTQPSAACPISLSKRGPYSPIQIPCREPGVGQAGPR